jgi:hypothetical protein
MFFLVFSVTCFPSALQLMLLSPESQLVDRQMTFNIFLGTG